VWCAEAWDGVEWNGVGVEAWDGVEWGGVGVEVRRSVVQCGVVRFVQFRTNCVSQNKW
jgi:hypothetical protein